MTTTKGGAPVFKKALAVLAVAGAGFVARRYLALRDAIGEIDPALRSPLLLLTGPMTTPRMRLSRPLARIKASAGDGVALTSRQAGDVCPVTVLVATPTRPGPRNRPALLWIHGGGMILGSPQLEAGGYGPLADELDVVVVSPDYRLAPEHPFPAALDDCMTALHWMRDHAEELGLDPDRIAVIGSSAGGGLSAAVAQRAHDEGIALRAQILCYPMLDDRTALRDNHCGRGRFMWTAQSNRFGWTAYLGRPPRLSDAPEYAAPARRTDLSGLAPAWIGVGTLDLFYDESVAYAEALRASGVPCELLVVPGMYHGADIMAPKAPAMTDFRRKSVDYLRGRL
ncbi:alpha/beta hydrolase [Mycobacterium shigaense]|uniref:alpha/beta hydrolase n=1 Tax=Mycobacterium shigaense TaxID=722731 RepID=UPI001E5C2C5A|nr:alpha/beta hydrolase [Mycobacterium shigaense]MEA1121341.1 alpha/beta hydrolase [Mycobacterium shigaense]